MKVSPGAANRMIPAEIDDTPASKSNLRPGSPVTSKMEKILTAIEENDTNNLSNILASLTGCNLSVTIATSRLPKSAQKIARVINTTPLRFAVTWGSRKALEGMLQSECQIEQDDKDRALEKAIRYYRRDPEYIDMIQQLMAHGARVLEYIHLYRALAINLNRSGPETCNELVQTMIQSNCCWSQGKLLMSLVQDGSYCKYDEFGTGSPKTQTVKWEEFRDPAIQQVLLSGFDPEQYIHLELQGSVQNKLQPLQLLTPLLIQNTPCVCGIAKAVLYGQFSIQRTIWPKSLITTTLTLLWHAGYPFSASHIPLSRYLTIWGTIQNFTTKPRTLQELCRLSARRHITTPNVYAGVAKLPNFPLKLRNYLLMCEVRTDNLPLLSTQHRQ